MVTDILLKTDKLINTFYKSELVESHYELVLYITDIIKYETVIQYFLY